MSHWCPCCGQGNGIVFQHPVSMVPICIACQTAFPGNTLAEDRTKARVLKMTLDEFEWMKKMAKEAEQWDDGTLDPKPWDDVPQAIPRANEPAPVSIRLPQKMIAVLEEFSRREGIGYQTLMKKWLDDRIRKESGRPSLEERVDALEKWRAEEES